MIVRLLKDKKKISHKTYYISAAPEPQEIFEVLEEVWFDYSDTINNISYVCGLILFYFQTKYRTSYIESAVEMPRFRRLFRVMTLEKLKRYVATHEIVMEYFDFSERERMVRLKKAIMKEYENISRGK